MTAEHGDLSIRPARLSEAGIIVGHRRAMLAEIRQPTEALLDAIDTAFGPWLAERMARSEYLGWLAVNANDEVVGGAGLWLMEWLPHLMHVEPRRGNIVNVYVQPAYRRRGLARALTETAVGWCRENRVNMVILHASEAGRPIYEALGFKATNEMSLIFAADPPLPGQA